MLELIVAASVVAGLLVVAIRGRTDPSSPEGRLDPWRADPDLPCPWCRAATREEDPSCPSCGRAFGQA